jgi:hypothetical protein
MTANEPALATHDAKCVEQQVEAAELLNAIEQEVSTHPSSENSFAFVCESFDRQTHNDGYDA